LRSLRLCGEDCVEFEFAGKSACAPGKSACGPGKSACGPGKSACGPGKSACGTLGFAFGMFYWKMYLEDGWEV